MFLNSWPLTICLLREKSWKTLVNVVGLLLSWIKSWILRHIFQEVLCHSQCLYRRLCVFLWTDIIWVILSVEVGGLLGVTQQLSSFQAEFNTQPHRSLEGDYNPFASPEKSKCPNGNGSLHQDTGHRVSEEHWQRIPSQLQPDQNGLSHNSEDLVANSLQSNLSIVSYNQVRHILKVLISLSHGCYSMSLHLNYICIYIHTVYTQFKWRYDCVRVCLIYADTAVSFSEYACLVLDKAYRGRIHQVRWNRCHVLTHCRLLQ